MFKTMSVLFWLLLASVSAYSQAVNGTLVGTVTDSQGAAVSGAKVTITNPATGTNRGSATDGGGGFVFALLPVGVYNLNVEQTGFRKFQRNNIRLQTNENIQADATLDLGSVRRR